MRPIKILSILAAGVPLLLLVLALAPGGGAGLAPTAKAEVTGEAPVFTTPLHFTHPYFPFQPGGMKVFAGRDENGELTTVERHLDEIRMFPVNGEDVPCAVVEETEFVQGGLKEISYNFYAQADDGSIWYFGEYSEAYEDGEVVSREGSWLVGGPLPGDPPDTATGEHPALHLPANPEVGDEWMEENLPAFQIGETRKVIRARRKIRTRTGRYTDCIEVKEKDFDGERERKFYAPGIGIVKVQGDEEKLKLVATTVRR